MAFMRKWFHRLISHQLLLRASSLAFWTLLGSLPAVALLQATTWFAPSVMGELEKWVNLVTEQNNLSPAPTNYAQQLFEIMRERMNTVPGIKARVFSSVILFGSFFGLVTTIESAFNAIWDQKKGHHPIKRGLVLMAIIAMVPPLLWISAGSTALLHTAQLAGSHIPATVLLFAINSLFLMIANKVMPSRKVSWRAAIVGGMVGAGIWQIIRVLLALHFSVLTQSSPVRFILGPFTSWIYLLLGIYTGWLGVLCSAEATRVAHEFLRKKSRKM